MPKCPRYILFFLTLAFYISTISVARSETISGSLRQQHHLILKEKGNAHDPFDFFILAIDDDDDDISYGKKKQGKYFSESSGAFCFVPDLAGVIRLSHGAEMRSARSHSPLPSARLLNIRCLRI